MSAPDDLEAARRALMQAGEAVRAAYAAECAARDTAALYAGAVREAVAVYAAARKIQERALQAVEAAKAAKVRA